jgi:hypothetical protein
MCRRSFQYSLQEMMVLIGILSLLLSGTFWKIVPIGFTPIAFALICIAFDYASSLNRGTPRQITRRNQTAILACLLFVGVWGVFIAISAGLFNASSSGIEARMKAVRNSQSLPNDAVLPCQKLGGRYADSRVFGG